MLTIAENFSIFDVFDVLLCWPLMKIWKFKHQAHFTGSMSKLNCNFPVFSGCLFISFFADYLHRTPFRLSVILFFFTQV